VRSLALAALVITAGCATQSVCPVYRGTASKQPLLWRVSGDGGEVIIQATHQAAADSDLSPTAFTLIDRADVYVTEAAEPSEREHEAKEWRRATQLRRTTLPILIGGETFERLALYVGLPGSQLQKLKPWVAYVLLGREAYEFPRPSMNQALLARADARGMPVEFLDSWDQQVSYLDQAITPQKLGEAIDDFEQVGCKLEYEIAAFRAGDEAAFASEREWEDAPSLRTQRWLRRIDTLLTRGFKAFFAIGVEQLAGPSGMLARLSAAGLHVERL